MYVCNQSILFIDFVSIRITNHLRVMGLVLNDFKEYFSQDPEDDLFYDNHKPFLDDLERWASLCSAAFERATFISGCLNGKVYFISDSLAEISGYKKSEIMEKHTDFLHQIIHPTDRIFIGHIMQEMFFDLFENKDITEPNQYSSRFNIRIRNKNNEWIFLECMSYPIYEIKGKLHFSITHLKVSDKKFRHMFQIYFTNDNLRYIYHLKKKKFVLEEKASLSETELKILINTARGLKEHEIAREIEMDVNMVKYYKKTILKKLSARSMPEAIYFALKQNML